MASALLNSLRETRSRIKRALITLQQAKAAEETYNQAIDECRNELERALDWIEEAVENQEAKENAA